MARSLAYCLAGRVLWVTCVVTGPVRPKMIAAEQGLAADGALGPKDQGFLKAGIGPPAFSI